MDQQQYTTLVDLFSHLPDPRKRKGRRHRWLTLLCLIAAALASAHRTPGAIARWVLSHREELFALLPASVSRLPSEATIRRALALLDVAVLEQALSAFQPGAPEPPDTAAGPPDSLQGVACDRKAIRGVGRTGHPSHLVSLVEHASARVLGQLAVARKRDERSAVPFCLHYFKLPLDTFNKRDAFGFFSDYFSKCEWYEVYDFIEFSSKNYIGTELSERFRDYCNLILEREVSAYRFVDRNITQITDETEIAEIEKALASTLPIQSLNSHLKRALELLSDRSAPDYRNSIKEAISAVEGICKLIIKDPNTTLGAALNEIEKSRTINLHKNLKEAFKHLYWYTSDAGGIRHAIKDSSSVDFDDAKFMLVCCSAFVNYLLAQSVKAGISL